MYFEDHNPPHFHVKDGDGREAEILLADLSVRKGQIDRRALREALAYGEAELEALRRRWDDYNPT